MQGVFIRLIDPAGGLDDAQVAGEPVISDKIKVSGHGGGEAFEDAIAGVDAVGDAGDDDAAGLAGGVVMGVDEEEGYSSDVVAFEWTIGGSEEGGAVRLVEEEAEGVGVEVEGVEDTKKNISRDAELPVGMAVNPDEGYGAWFGA